VKSLNELLALCDALLSAAAIAFMILGVRAIRRGRNVARHLRCMVAAFCCSALFLLIFGVRFVEFGFRPFGGHGAARVFYSVVFFTHEPLAVINVPLVVAALVLGARGSFATHREVARMAYPIWLYVAATGVLLYLLLYVAR
jgi:putative membrane protein